LDDDFWRRLLDEFDPGAYRSLYPDLTHMTDASLLAHYKNFGRKEGRTGNRLRNREDFAALVPCNVPALEIGPFNNPLLRGPNVSYFDVLAREALVARATASGLDPSKTPQIDYVSSTGDLSIIDQRFDVVISSHCIEHQPNLVHHLQQVRCLLRDGGTYFLLVPDKRYCFDHYIPFTNIAEIIIAHNEQRQMHTLRSVIEHRALTTHNDGLRHWQGDHGTIFENLQPRVQAAVREFDDARGNYIDVHAWYFSSGSAAVIFSALQSLGLSQLSVQRVYPTRYGANEFWMILGGQEEYKQHQSGGLEVEYDSFDTHRAPSFPRGSSKRRWWPLGSRE
jgi:SAM-dependent methyltransferase